MKTKFIAFRVSQEILKKLEYLCKVYDEQRSSVLISLIISEYTRQQEMISKSNLSNPNSKLLLVEMDT